MWLSGLWVYFLPVGAVQLFAKGCKLGFSTSVFVRIFGLKGIFFAFLAALPQFVAIIPDYELKTEKARACLPKEVSHKDAVYNLSRAALFSASLLTGKFENLRTGVHDRLHQPYRMELMPHDWHRIRFFALGFSLQFQRLCLKKLPA